MHHGLRFWAKLKETETQRPPNQTSGKDAPIMLAAKRIFNVVEVGQSKSASSCLEFRDSEFVEIVDLTTRSHNRIKAREVSIYRHFLQFQGKLFNILGLLK
jgi:hypothetical protein